MPNLRPAVAVLVLSCGGINSLPPPSASPETIHSVVAAAEQALADLAVFRDVMAGTPEGERQPTRALFEAYQTDYLEPLLADARAIGGPQLRRLHDELEDAQEDVAKWTR